jgi:long-chain fatty acid transport protein
MRSHHFRTRFHFCRRYLVYSPAFLVCVTLGQPAWATGFFLNQQSPKETGRADAGNTVAGDELATIFYNPAALPIYFQNPNTSGWVWSAGITVTYPQLQIDNTGSFMTPLPGVNLPVSGPRMKNPTDPTPLPTVFTAEQFGNWSFGGGINAPFGLSTASQHGWFGRYDAIKARLETINFSVVAAYKVSENLSIGGGINEQYAFTKIVQALPNLPSPNGISAATDGRSESTGHAWTTGFNLGFVFTFDESSDTRFGVHYRSGMRHILQGSVVNSGVSGPLGQLINGRFEARAGLNLPGMLTAGISHKFADAIWYTELEWDNWSTLKQVQTVLSNGFVASRQYHYRDAYGVAVGVDLPLTEGWTVRGGVHYDTTPTTDAWRDTVAPDTNRMWLAVGATYDFANGISFDVGYHHLFFQHGTIALTRVAYEETPAATPITINGSVRTSVDNLSFAVRKRF